MERDQLLHQTREGLVGRYFSNNHELHQIAELVGLELAAGQSFDTDGNRAHATMVQQGLGMIRIKAARTALWQPFFIIDIALA
jgi:hypothetical protein